MNKPGVLLVLNTLEAGGAELFALRLAKYIRNDFRCFVVTPMEERNDPDFMGFFLHETGATHIPLYKGPGPLKERLLWKINAACQLFGVNGVYRRLYGWCHDQYWKRQLRDANIQICNSHFFTSELFVLRTLHRVNSKLKWVVTMHSSYNPEVYEDFAPDVRAKFDKDVIQIFSTCAHIFCVADRNRQLFAALGIQRKIEKVYLGYELPAVMQEVPSPFGKDHIVFAMIGRGVATKGWSIALKAFRRVKELYPQAGMLCVGPETEYMRQLKTDQKDMADLHFTGYVEDTAPWVALSHVGLLPSHGESLPYSIIEFLGQGRPVIASDRGEIPLMLTTESGIAGAILPDDADGLPSVDTLSMKMAHYINDRSLLHEHMDLASIAFQKFSMAQCGGRYLEVFKQLMDGKA